MPVVFRAPAETGLTIQGILTFDSDVLTIEVEKPRLFKRPETKRLEIPIGEIDWIEFRRGPMGARMNLRTLYFETARQLPWRKGIEVAFSFPRKERDEAERLASRIEDAIVESHRHADARKGRPRRSPRSRRR